MPALHLRPHWLNCRVLFILLVFVGGPADLNMRSPLCDVTAQEPSCDFCEAVLLSAWLVHVRVSCKFRTLPWQLAEQRP